MKKRVISLLLCLCLMASLGTAFAAEGEPLIVGMGSKTLGDIHPSEPAPAETPEEPEESVKPAPVEEPAPTEEPVPEETPEPTGEPAPEEEPVPAEEPLEQETAPVQDGAVNEALRELLGKAREVEGKEIRTEVTKLESPVADPTNPEGMDVGAGELVLDGAAGDADAAIPEVREHLVARETEFSVSFREPYDAGITDAEIGVLGNALFYAAVEHTGRPKEGDYIFENFSECSIATSYWVSGGYFHFTITYKGIVYLASAQQEQAVDAAVTALLAELGLGGASDYEKVCAVYDWICANVDYDYDNLENDSYLLKHSTYAALVQKKAVCQGYASLFYRLALELGVDARVITGMAYDGATPAGAHAWNIVALDGSYYNLDATWDAPRAAYGMPYDYFLCGSDNFPEHERDADYTTAVFMAAYPMSSGSYVPLVAGVICGDVNGDEAVDSLDAALVLRRAAGIIGDDELQVEACDVNRDGKVDSLDAALILRFAAGIIQSFAASAP